MEEHEAVRESDVMMIVSAAIEIAATIPGAVTKSGLYSKALTILGGALIKTAISSGVTDFETVIAPMRVLWDGVTITGNSRGGDA